MLHISEYNKPRKAHKEPSRGKIKTVSNLQRFLSHLGGACIRGREGGRKGGKVKINTSFLTRLDEKGKKRTKKTEISSINIINYIRSKGEIVLFFSSLFPGVRGRMKGFSFENSFVLF